jgi:hypothetical protein
LARLNGRREWPCQDCRSRPSPGPDPGSRCGLQPSHRSCRTWSRDCLDRVLVDTAPLPDSFQTNSKAIGCLPKQVRSVNQKKKKKAHTVGISFSVQYCSRVPDQSLQHCDRLLSSAMWCLVNRRVAQHREEARRQCDRSIHKLAGYRVQSQGRENIRSCLAVNKEAVVAE